MFIQIKLKRRITKINNSSKKQTNIELTDNDKSLVN